MAVTLTESLGFEAPKVSGNRWRVKVIEAGWGSSGYYGANMLATYGPEVFKSGTKVFMNHPSMSEASDRPERDVHQLAGKLVSDAVFDQDGLFADVEFYSHYAPIIREMWGDVGLSISALGTTTLGEAEGRNGNIVESLVADPLTSVDVVTVAGAGGKFVSLLESYKINGSEALLSESFMEGNEMSITKEEFEAAVADLKTTLVETLAPLRESITALVEAAAPAEEETETEEEAVPALDPVEVAEAFNESGLPKIAIARVAEALKSETNTKTVEELLEAEKAYAASLRESIAPAAAEVVGVVHEAGKATTAQDDFDAVMSRILGKK
jgi:hypothetical protein